MNGVIGILGVVAILLLVGGLAALARPGRVSWIWLAVAAVLVLLNDALLTSLYGLLPQAWPGADWNWQGKSLALAATLGLAALPAFGWRESGLAWPDLSRGWVTVAAVCGLYVAVFLGLALAFPNEPASAETIAFQLTLPGFEEEAFYRGLLLLALARALGGPVGAVVSCGLFGLAHAFGFSKGAFHFDGLTFLLTAGPSLIAAWLAVRTRSVLLPIGLHNFGNAIMLLV